jgi:Arc/MetJ-type ribon-helix-helix transcriptional regulator
VWSGGYQNENEVVRDAIRQMQQREIEQFDGVFSKYPRAPQGEATNQEHAAMKAAVERHRGGKQSWPVA